MGTFRFDSNTVDLGKSVYESVCNADEAGASKEAQ